MTVASTRTKVEQALSRSFAAVAGQLPGGPAVAKAREAAIGTFAALGLPHRRIEQWKWTDLRSALKEALPPAVGDAGTVAAGEIDAALEELAALDAHRVVFVEGVHAPQRAAPAHLNGLQITPLAEMLLRSDGAALAGGSAEGHETVLAL